MLRKKDLFKLENFPQEILAMILSYLHSQDLKIASLMNIYFYQVANHHIWPKIYQRSFPGSFKQILPQESVNWQTLFNRNELIEYTSIATEQRRLFTWVKENNIEQLEKINFLTIDPHQQDKRKIPLSVWMQQYLSQKLLDNYYQMVMNDDKTPDKKRLYWALACNQKLENLEDLLTAYLNTEVDDSQESRWMKKFLRGKNHPLHLATMLGRSDIVKWLMQNDADLKQKINKKSCLTPLMLAAKHGHKMLVEYFIEQGAELELSIHDEQMRENCTALSLATMEDHVDIVELLLTYELKREPYNLIHIAAKNGALTVVKFLLESQPDLLNRKDSHAYSPLIAAILYGKANVALYLMDKNADTTQIIDGQNVLHFAAEGGNCLIVEKLLAKHPLLIDSVNNSKLTPLMLAIRHNHIDLIHYLMTKTTERKIEPQQLFSLAGKAGHISLLKILSKKYHSLNWFNDHLSYTNSLLLWAATKGHDKLIKNLIKQGDVNLTVTTQEKKNLLHLAATNCSSSVNRLLLKHAPQLIDQRDKYGNTPLDTLMQDACAHGFKPRYAELVILFIKAIPTITKESMKPLRDTIHALKLQDLNIYSIQKLTLLFQKIDVLELNNKTQLIIKLFDYIIIKRNTHKPLAQKKIDAAHALLDLFYKPDCTLKKLKNLKKEHPTLIALTAKKLKRIYKCCLKYYKPSDPKKSYITLSC